MNNRKSIFFILFILSASLSIGQGVGKLRGVISDSSTGEVLAYSNIFIKNLGIGVAADERGFFIISSLPIDENYSAEVSYVGYEKQTIQFSIYSDKITDVKVSLIPLDIELQTIEKIGERVYGENVTDIGIQKITAKKLEALPKGVESDIFRMIQYLPGIQSSSDVSARFHVRGGASNQNQFLLDDIEIYNPFHALGLFGVVDPEVINNVELHIGGFSAEHTGKISSVMNMFTKEGNKNRISGSTSGSLMSIKGLVEGPIPNGSFIVSGRKSYSNRVLNTFLEQDDTPIDFYDIFAKASYSNDLIMPNANFTLTIFSSGDRIVNNNTLLADVKWSNNVVGIKWMQFTEEPMFYTIQISRSEFKGDLIPNLSGIKPVRNNVLDYMAKFDVSYVFNNKDEIVGGMKLNEITTDLFLRNSLNLVRNIGPQDIRANVGIYLKYKLMRWKDFLFDVGSRLNLIGVSRGGNNIFFEPRISFAYNFAEEFSLKSSWGVYQQEITTLTDEDEVITYFEPWLVTPKYLAPTRSYHYVLGLEYRNGSNLAIDMEGYYKNVDNLPGLNENKILMTDHDLVSGTSEAYGLDAMFRLSSEIFNLSTSYSWGWVTKNINNLEYHPRFDIRNSLKIIFESMLYKGWRASVVWIYNTGMPFTQLGGFYDKLNFDNPYDKLSIFGSQSISPILGGRNIQRLPDYHRLDLNISKSFNIYFVKMNLDLSLINIYDRKNLFYFNRDTGERINMLPFLPTITIKAEI